MLAKLKVKYVIVGHSERRELFGETDDMVNRKVRAVLANGMTPIVCVGETLEEREAGATEGKVLGQVAEAFAGVSKDEVGGLRRGLRADLGDRHRPQRHARRRRGHDRGHPRRRRRGGRGRKRPRRCGSSTAGA